MVVNLPVFLEHQQFQKPEVHTNDLCFETDKLFFLFILVKKLGHLNNWNTKNLF